MPNTTNYNWNIPTVGADLDVWGDENNAAWMLCDAEMFLKANKANPVFTGAITAPAFIGNPNIVLKPTVDGPKGIDMQNAAGVTRASLNTIDGTFSVPGFLSSQGYSGNPKVMIRPAVDSASSIELQNAAGTVVVAIGTPDGKTTFSSPAGIVADLYGSSSNIVLRPGADGVSAVWFQKAGGLGTAAAIDTTNNRIVAGSGGVRSILYEGNSNITMRPLADGPGAFQVQSAAGAVKLSLNTSDGTLSVTGFLSSSGYVGNPTVRLQPATDGANAHVFTNAAGAIKVSINSTDGTISTPGFVSATGYMGSPTLILRPGANDVAGIGFQNAGGTVNVMQVDTTNQRVGIGSDPAFKVHVYGPGTPQTGVFNQSQNLGNTIFVSDSNSAGAAGGAVVFGSGVSAFAAIRAGFVNGAGYGVGSLHIYVRADTGVEAMTEVARFNPGGGMSLPGLVASNPGAGSKALWYDPADGNRVKYAP